VAVDLVCNMEDDMADKTSTPGRQSDKPRPQDRLVTDTKENNLELTEEELKKVSGGEIDKQSGTLFR
jgi:bacteriocin-like protein